MAITSQDADKFRLKHAKELQALFEDARGRPARTTDELAQWLDSVDDDLADDIAREVAEEAGRKVGREAAKKNGREAYEEASYRAYEQAYERVLDSLKKARRLDRPRLKSIAGGPLRRKRDDVWTWRRPNDDTRRPDCLAGHEGLELRNVGAKYSFERSHGFPGIRPNSDHRDYSRL